MIKINKKGLKELLFMLWLFITHPLQIILGVWLGFFRPAKKE